MNMNIETRYKIYLSAMIWLTFLLSFMVGIGLMGMDFGGFAVLLAVAAMAINGFIWQGVSDESANDSSQASKAKNMERINNVLDQFTDDELEALRARLNGSAHEEEVEMILTDDGELVERYAR